MAYTIEDDKIDAAAKRLKELTEGTKRWSTHDNAVEGKINPGDAHTEADEILLGLLPKKVASQFKKITKWYE